MNNFEKIKSMSINEIAELLVNRRGCEGCPALDLEQACLDSCKETMKVYLESEAEE